MTQMRRSQLERAIERAQREGLYIVGRGLRKADGARVICISNGSAGECYPVTIASARRERSCRARGTICKLSRLAHALIGEEHDEVGAGQGRHRDTIILPRPNRLFSIFKS